MHGLMKVKRKEDTKYFYKPVKLRTLQEITADIKALEEETDGLLNEIIGG